VTYSDSRDDEPWRIIPEIEDIERGAFMAERDPNVPISFALDEQTIVGGTDNQASPVEGEAVEAAAVRSE
jgi:hypothetical protein